LKEDKLPKFAFSAKVTTLPCSYVPSTTPIDKKALTPAYIHHKVWRKLKGIKMKHRFFGQKLSKTFELVCIDEELLKN
jgi:hypothetical protein